MSTKNSTWEYEKEWRCVEQVSGLKTIVSPISEVVFGIKCPKNVRKKYINLAKKYCDNSICFYEIVLEGKAFKKKELLM